MTGCTGKSAVRCFCSFQPCQSERKQQMTQKKEMKTQDIEVPQSCSRLVDCRIFEGHEIPLHKDRLTLFGKSGSDMVSNNIHGRS